MSLPSFKRNFGGAIFLADWLKKNHFGISTAIRANVSPGFVDCVATLTGKAVFFHWLPELKSISICLKKADKYVILIPQIFNPCHRRFALCKELCHVLTDDPFVKAKNPSEQLEIAIHCSEFVRAKESILFAQDLDSENFCFLLAMEMMIPTSHRDTILERIKRQESTYDIAHGLQMPESLIIYYHESRYNLFYNLHLLAMANKAAAN